MHELSNVDQKTDKSAHGYRCEGKETVNYRRFGIECRVTAVVGLFMPLNEPGPLNDGTIIYKPPK